MGLTGALLMFRPELSARWNAAMLRVAPAAQEQSLDRVVEAARQAHPQVAIDLVRSYSEPTASVQVEFVDNAAVFVDPHTAAVLGVGSRYGAFFYGVEQVHRYLALGPGGTLITGTCALTCAFLILTGAYLWLPPVWRAVKSGLVFNPRLSGRAWHFNLHKVLGIYAGAFVLFSALTGAPDALDWCKRLEFRLGGPAPAKAPPSVVPAGAHPARASWQHLLESIRSMDPTAHEIVIHNPEKPRDSVTAFFVDAKAEQPDARTVVYFDAYSGSILRTFLYAASGRGYRMYFWGLTLHQGLVGGIIWRLAILGGALSLPWLAFTGAMMFYRRKFRMRAAN